MDMRLPWMTCLRAAAIVAAIAVLAACASAPAASKPESSAEKATPASQPSAQAPAPSAPAEDGVKVPAPAPASSGAAIDPANLIPHSGKRIFLNGMNLAWMDYAKDLDRFNEGKFTEQAENIAAAGGNCIRWWIFVNGSRSPAFGEDGLVKELAPEQILVVKRALDIAFERGVGLILCLWSFDLLQKQAGADLARNVRLIEDPAATKAFIDRALLPLVRRVKSHPGLIAWEVFNEPEGMLPSFGWTSKRTSMEAVQGFINRVAGAIHREAPGSLVTNGSWNIQVATDIGGLINYYRDDRLIEAGGDKDGVLDFYSVHYYPEYFDEGLSPFHNPKSHWGLDKPLVIAEFPAKGIVPITGHSGFAPKSRLSSEEAYRYAIENGYAGALSWTMTNHDGYGGFFHCADAMSGISEDYASFIALDRSGLDRGPRVVKPLTDLILNVAQRSWPDVLDLKAFVQDPEDGSDITFALVVPGDSQVASLSLSPAGKLSVTLAGAGKLGSIPVSLIARDKADNETPASFMIHVIDPDRGNVALLKPVVASSVENTESLAAYANDGNPKTRWSSEYKDGQWLVIDLQGTFTVTKAVLAWEAAYGKLYDILGSADGESWTLLASVADSDGGIDEVALAPAKVRSVKLDAKVRGTQWGFSLWEIEIIGERVK